MRRYLLDTGIDGHLIAKRLGVDGRVRQAVLKGDRVGLCMPVLGELWSGMRGSASRDRNIQQMKHALARLRIWPFDRKAAEEYGRIFVELKRLGRPMQQIDIQIAAIALTLGNCTVVKGDSDFVAVPGAFRSRIGLAEAVVIVCCGLEFISPLFLHLARSLR